MLRCSDAIVKLLEDAGVKYVFGHPGEHVLSLYDSLRTSTIKHVLVRHEQGAAHAADGYARASNKLSVCISTGGPGALNLVMGVATAYKDSIPLIVITGDIARDQQGADVFQEIDLNDVFKPVTRYSSNPSTAKEAILTFKKNILLCKKEPMGPIHININKDVLEEKIEEDLVLKKVEYSPLRDYAQIEEAINLLESANKPLVVAGAGILWGKADVKFREFIEKQEVPFATTYHARGVISEDHPLCLGMIGMRGTPTANYAGENCDIILSLGCKLSERTIAGFGTAPIIQVNINKKTLKGDLNLLMDVREFLEKINSVKICPSKDWIITLRKHSRKFPPPYDKPPNCRDPLKPHEVIGEIFSLAPDSIIVNDAGSHTTWVTLYRKVLESNSLIFSGAFGPMGYGIPASIGVSFARPGKKVILIIGDGGFQMTLQELGTIMEEELPIVICILNNRSLGIIRQWQELKYKKSYGVHLKNPDFVKLAKSYNINARRIERAEEIKDIILEALKIDKPFLIEIKVEEEDIPLPKVSMIDEYSLNDP